MRMRNSNLIRTEFLETNESYTKKGEN